MHRETRRVLRRLLASLLFAGCLSRWLPAQNQPDEELLKRAVELHQSGHYTEAIQAYEVFLKAHPDAAGVRSNLGAALIHEGHYPDAIQQYKLALTAQPSNSGIR